MLMIKDNIADKQLDNSKRVRGRPFPKGVSGNPKGRPPNESTLRYWLIQYLEAKEHGHDKNRMQELAEKIALEAFKGDKLLLKEVFDRVDGKAPETIRHEGEIDTGIKELSETLLGIIRHGQNNPRPDKSD